MEEGALFRGAIANGLKLAALCSSMTIMYDTCKENSYFFFGPSAINRLFATFVAVTMGTAVSMPFDMVRTRLHTMRPLPNGVMPYQGTLDCLVKVRLLSKFHFESYRSSDMSVTRIKAPIFNPCTQV